MGSIHSVAPNLELMPMAPDIDEEPDLEESQPSGATTKGSNFTSGTDLSSQVVHSTVMIQPLEQATQSRENKISGKEDTPSGVPRD